MSSKRSPQSILSKIKELEYTFLRFEDRVGNICDDFDCLKEEVRTRMGQFQVDLKYLLQKESDREIEEGMP